MTRSLPRRLERLEAVFRPPIPRVLTIIVTRVGAPDRKVELTLKEPIGRRQQYWNQCVESDRFLSSATNAFRSY